jgi:1-acyl-sn-glycerol-3-phosphate acyltransferase
MKILAYPLSVIFYLVFGLILVIFHVIQWLAYNLGGYHAHHKAVKAMDWSIFQSTRILGTSYHFSGREKIPKAVPLIFVSNHQSMFDIPPLEWYLSSFHPKFISKIELGKGIPSVSYNLKKGGSVLIDRSDSKQALSEIKKLAKYIEIHHRSAILFPEGTRSRNGKLKRFHENGLKVLTKYSPNAIIVPITINNSWELLKYGSFPLSLGTKFKLEIHEPISTKGMTSEELIENVRAVILSGLNNQ